MAAPQQIVFTRGVIYYADFDDDIGEKPWLVVSNNGRNRRLGTALAVRVTSSRKPELASIVELTREDLPTYGRVLCDDIGPLYPHEVTRVGPALSMGTMMRVSAALRHALAI